MTMSSHLWFYPVTSSPPPPNIIVFLVDDMGWMDTGCYGSTSYETPNIDQLAHGGLRFTDAYAPNPLCTPSRAGLLTGRYPSRFRLTQPEGHLPPQSVPKSGYQSTGPPHLPYISPESLRFLDSREPTIAKFLSSNGYKTGFFGKWHLGLPEWAWPDRFGFDQTWHGYPDNGPPLPHGYFAPYSFSNNSLQALNSEEYLVERVTDESVRFMQMHIKSQSPFFLFISQYGVHAPWQAPEHDVQRYHQHFHQQHKNSSSSSQNNPIMAAMVNHVDKSVGRIMETLQSFNLVDNTFVIFTSDNGGDASVNSFLHRTLKKAQIDPSHKLPEWMRKYRHYAGETSPTNNFPLRAGKGSLYEGGLRIPLIFHYPSLIPSHGVSHTPVSILDIFPTITQLVSSLGKGKATKDISSSREPDLQLDGVSLLPLLKDFTHQLDRQSDGIYGFYPHGPVSVSGVSLRFHNWKFIRRFASCHLDQKVRSYELYDLSKDIGETENLSEIHSELVKQFNDQIDNFLASTNSLIPIPNPAYNKTLERLCHGEKIIPER
jgi:arylsulfatase A-like enzyme